MSFIVIEGLDGSGKSTQMKKFNRYLKDHQIDSEYLHFPRTDSPVYGDLISRFLRGELGAIEQVHPYLVALLFAGDRAETKSQLNQWLASGKTIVLDRYVYSNIAFQCAKLATHEEQDELRKWILETEFNHFKIPKPHMSIFLDVPFSFIQQNLENNRCGNDRTYLQGREDIHEQDLQFQEKVRQMYLRTAETSNELQVLNCVSSEGTMKSPETIFQELLHLLNKHNIL
jgi:dTMP kinase